MIVYDGPGDLFQFQGDAIVCPINAAGVMGNGLARAFRERVPGLFEFFLEKYPKTDDNLKACWQAGYLHLFENHHPKILLFPTKVFFYRDSIPALIDHNLGILAQHYREMGLQTIALPHLGCGKGNLNFQFQVKPLIHRHFQDHPLSVSILG